MLRRRSQTPEPQFRGASSDIRSEKCSTPRIQHIVIPSALTWKYRSQISCGSSHRLVRRDSSPNLPWGFTPGHFVLFSSVFGHPPWAFGNSRRRSKNTLDRSAIHVLLSRLPHVQCCTQAPGVHPSWQWKFTEVEDFFKKSEAKPEEVEQNIKKEPKKPYGHSQPSAKDIWWPGHFTVRQTFPMWGQAAHLNETQLITFLGFCQEVLSPIYRPHHQFHSRLLFFLNIFLPEADLFAILIPFFETFLFLNVLLFWEGLSAMYGPNIRKTSGGSVVLLPSNVRLATRFVSLSRTLSNVSSHISLYIFNLLISSSKLEIFRLLSFSGNKTLFIASLFLRVYI